MTEKNFQNCLEKTRLKKRKGGASAGGGGGGGSSYFDKEEDGLSLLSPPSLSSSIASSLSCNPIFTAAGSLTKKLHLEEDHSKTILPKNTEFVYTVSDFKFDKCPICLKTNIKDMDYSCEKCSAYICKYCFMHIHPPKKCPLCKEISLRQNSFKEKMLLEYIQAQCPKCKKSIKLSDNGNFAIVKHKIECFLQGWILDKMHGEINILDDLVDCLTRQYDLLNTLPCNFLDFVAKIEKETDIKWNIFVSKCSSSHTKHYLSIQRNDWREYLTFFI